MSDIEQPGSAYRRVTVLTVALFLSYLTVAISLPAVPIHVVQGLGLTNAYGGLAVGSAFLSTIFTRGRAGAYVGRIGGKHSMQRGLLIYAAASLICLVANWPGLPVGASYTVLIVGRLLLGVGESVANVGMISWSIGLMGQARTGRVMALVGIGMYGAYAIGGPLGVALLGRPWASAPCCRSSA